MSSERPIHIELGMPPRSGEARADSDKQPMPEQRSARELAEDARRLRELTAMPSNTAPAAQSLTPFSLFGAAARAASMGSSNENLERLEAALSNMARQLLVGEGRSGSPTVKIQLDDPKLPGVVMDVFEAEGSVVAEFVCKNEDTRERLASAARWLAESLSERLQRDTLVRVSSDDPEDPCLTEARGSATAISDSAHLP